MKKEKKVQKAYMVRPSIHDEAVALVSESEYKSVSAIVEYALYKFNKSEKKKRGKGGENV